MRSGVLRVFRPGAAASCLVALALLVFPARGPFAQTPADGGWGVPADPRLKVFASNQLGMEGRPFAELRNPGPELFSPGTPEKEELEALGRLLKPRPEASAESFVGLLIEGRGPSGPMSFLRLYERGAASGSWAPVFFRRTRPEAENVLEEEYRGGLLRFRTLRTPKHRVLWEERYGTSGNPPKHAMTEKLTYRYEGDLLVGFESRSGTDRRLYDASLRYDLSGHLRSLTRSWADGSRDIMSFQFVSLGLRETWDLKPDSGSRWSYDSRNRLQSEEEWKNGELVKKKQYFYAGQESDSVVSTQTELPAEKIELVETFDERGRLSQSERYRDGSLVERLSQAFDEADRIVLKSKISAEGSEDWDYRFEGNELAEERYSRDGKTQSVVKYGGRNRIEEIYFDGALRLRVYFEASKKVKEEELRNGYIVRTRNYEP